MASPRVGLLESGSRGICQAVGTARLELQHAKPCMVEGRLSHKGIRGNDVVRPRGRLKLNLALSRICGLLRHRPGNKKTVRDFRTALREKILFGLFLLLGLRSLDGFGRLFGFGGVWFL